LSLRAIAARRGEAIYVSKNASINRHTRAPAVVPIARLHVYAHGLDATGEAVLDQVATAA